MSTSPTTTPVTINGVTVNIPLSGSSPNWAPAIIQAFELIAEALNISAGPYDIPPQNYVMTSNVNTNVPIPNLSFPVTAVSGAIVFYGVNRSSSGVGAEQLSQTGLLILNYDPTQAPGFLWQVTDEFSSSSSSGAQITFTMSDTGQLQFSTTAITGTTPVGNINFRALAVLNS
jgi:hypothetical protein